MLGLGQPKHGVNNHGSYRYLLIWHQIMSCQAASRSSSRKRRRYMSKEYLSISRSEHENNHPWHDEVLYINCVGMCNAEALSNPGGL